MKTSFSPHTAIGIIPGFWLSKPGIEPRICIFSLSPRWFEKSSDLNRNTHETVGRSNTLPDTFEPQVCLFFLGISLPWCSTNTCWVCPQAGFSQDHYMNAGREPPVHIQQRREKDPWSHEWSSLVRPHWTNIGHVSCSEPIIVARELHDLISSHQCHR